MCVRRSLCVRKQGGSVGSVVEVAPPTEHEFQRDRERLSSRLRELSLRETRGEIKSARYFSLYSARARRSAHRHVSAAPRRVAYPRRSPVVLIYVTYNVGIYVYTYAHH